MRLRFLGVGNSSAQDLGNSSAVVESGAGEPLLLIDCGPLVLPAYRQQYGRFDALERLGIEEVPSAEDTGCRCGEVLCGLIDPSDCALFAAKCTPDTPVGPCMVSSEGACSAWYKYARERTQQ